MASTPHDHEDAPSVTDHVHDNSWSVNLEQPEHADDRELVIGQAIEAIQQTTSGNHVNLVTHGEHGHPSEYLYAELEATSFDRAIEWKYVEQCGCGGHVTRIRIE